MNYIKQNIEKILGRSNSIYADIVCENQENLAGRFNGRKVLVIGAAGSIGSAFTKLILRYKVECCYLVDTNENTLVELVRDLRSSNLVLPKNFKTLCLSFNDVGFLKFLSNSSFDIIYNFAATKHVRSERDVYSAFRMVENNVIFNYNLIHNLKGNMPSQIFVVSSDKAVKPGSLMGATKAAMERLLINSANRNKFRFNSARFANVAFSDGSLPFGMLNRLYKKQPITAPSDIYRYFISDTEAGELCLLASGLGKHKEIFYPLMNKIKNLIGFKQIAKSILENAGYSIIECDSELTAKNWFFKNPSNHSQWPCYFPASDTSGEKTVEEFVNDCEVVNEERFNNLGVIESPVESDNKSIENFLKEFQSFERKNQWDLVELISILKNFVPEFNHISSNNNLDQKL